MEKVSMSERRQVAISIILYWDIAHHVRIPNVAIFGRALVARSFLLTQDRAPPQAFALRI